jgi:hypothetical protein
LHETAFLEDLPAISQRSINFVPWQFVPRAHNGGEGDSLKWLDFIFPYPQPTPRWRTHRLGSRIW